MNLRHALFYTLLLFSTELFGQVKIDNNISVTFPEKPETKEFSENIGKTKASLKAFYLNTEQQSLVVLRTALLEGDLENSKPASSTAELKEIYENDIKSQINSMKNKGFIFSDSLKVNIENQIAYRLKYTLADKKEEGAESIILFFKGIRYVFTYSKVNSFIPDEKDKFLNSITITNIQKTSQIETSEKTGINWFSYGLYAVLAIGFILYFRQASKKQSKNGINLKAVYCPNCNTKQPFIRIPKNASQTLYGGTTCPKCGTELDKYGNIV
jgi:hypothetical protein